ncbi:hypothetical protein [Curtobacterium sp. CFBP9011]|uniref:hypothetical protein n=1 Tax=Curtobacterium sp. CFBP9011 TaxID=3096530 RepID=UPI002A6AEC70|nr:hypothetical protein [Curtobacterium sp. CFBP9011]MDY1005536.1 hypothetical protein [Curtobacterium sp. CFBP9011]
MQKKTAVSLATLALILAIAGTGAAAATIASPQSSPETVRPATGSTVVQTTGATSDDDDGWPGQLPDADRFRELSRSDQQAVLRRVDRLLGDLSGSRASEGLVRQLSGYRGELARLRR